MKSRRDDILACLPATKADARKKTGLSPKTVLKWFDLLHEAHEIYIDRWVPHPRKGPRMAVYARGNKPDAPCKLQTLTRKQVHERYRVRCEKDGRADVKRAKDRSKWWEKKAKAKPQTPFSALFVVAGQGRQHA